MNEKPKNWEERFLGGPKKFLEGSKISDIITIMSKNQLNILPLSYKTLISYRFLNHKKRYESVLEYWQTSAI